jgi:hypothetical protein
MSSTRRILASQANGAQSRGPVTPQGKERSSQNALRHGLAAQAVVIKCESREAFQDCLDQFVARFLPADQVELSLVEEMAAAAWRLRRSWSVESRLLDSHIDEHLPGADGERIAIGYYNLASGPQLNLIHRYETRLHMAFQRALSSLVALQKARMRNEPSPISERDSPHEAYHNNGVEDPNDRIYNEGA